MARACPCRTVARTRTRTLGFTLLEVLIAIALLALMATLSYRAVSALSGSQSRLSAEAQHWRNLDLFFARLEGDLRQAMPRPVRVGDGVEPPWLGTPAGASDSSRLAFSRAGAEFNWEPGSAGQRLEYAVNAGAVELAYWPSFDRPAAAEARRYRLVEGVSRFRFRYLANDGRWLDVWPATGESALPRGVRVELVLDSGESIERWLSLR